MAETGEAKVPGKMKGMNLPPEIVVGEFVQQARDGNDELRMRDARHVSSLLSRHNAANRKVEPGATYEVALRKVKDAPEVGTVNVKIRAEDVGSLPTDAVIEKSEPEKKEAGDGSTIPSV